MNWEAMRYFLRFVQRIQILVVSAQSKDPKFNDVNRCAKVVYDLYDHPENHKNVMHAKRTNEVKEIYR